MSKYVQFSKKGLPAGTAIYEGERAPTATSITIIHYENQTASIQKDVNQEQTIKITQETHTGCLWINVDGLADVSFIERLCKQFKIHPLLIEDLLNINQRPKLDSFEDYLFIVFKMNESKPEDRRLKVEQMSMIILKNNVLLTFQERPGDAFDPIRERLKNPKARFYKFGIDYLAYAIMDAVVDDYLAALDYKSETLERLEKLLIKTPNNTFLTQLYELKRFLLNLTKVVRPLREIVNSLQHTDSPLLSPEISVFLRDLYDHALRILETTDNYREISTNMQDIYLSGVNLKMNETMKILTIFASIFIPLTFVASIYGMNFVHMPELQWKYGYYMVLGIMVCIASGLLLFFKKKKWF